MERNLYHFVLLERSLLFNTSGPLVYSDASNLGIDVSELFFIRSGHGELLSPEIDLLRFTVLLFK